MLKVDPKWVKQLYFLNETISFDKLYLTYNDEVLSIYDTDVTFDKIDDTTFKVNISYLNSVVSYEIFYILESEYYNLIVSSKTLINGTILDDTIYFNKVKLAFEYLNYLKSNKEKTVMIKNGIYREKVYLDCKNVTVMGENKELTKIVYNDYHAKIGYTGSKLSTYGSTTFSITKNAKNITVSNLTIENDFDYDNYPKVEGRQAVALTVEGDNTVIKNCVLLGKQDTLYARSGLQFYFDNVIYGHVDFIFGFGGPALFMNNDIVSLKHDKSFVSAQKGTYADEKQIIPVGYVFYKNRFLRQEGVEDNTVDLGRPWGKDAYSAFILNIFDKHITQEGFTSMSGNNPFDARYYYYENKTLENTLFFQEKFIAKKMTENEVEELLKIFNQKL